jgi:hypothetical protein
MNRDELIEHGRKVQDESLDRLRHTAKLFQQSREVGDAISEKLHGQDQNTQKTYHDLYDISEEVKTADKKVKRMSRREKCCVIS